ncbi:hypothetical protein [Kribbella shirazensis]|uniref:Uncharacterized protein n=1 Tax=Kribbella shirazensis TaxID=1105143 RepID=A0A7X5V9X4_9ACTN|nr:hypothetical protein [Kribbella shirazensis]NIK57370.1 hypothetical protein [Kribbella shirazensis]
MNTLQRQARLFRLVRHTAEPGSRMLAEGAEWSDGAVAVRWLGRWPNTAAWDGIESLLAVHATDEATQLQWLAPPTVQPTAPPQADQPAAPPAPVQPAPPAVQPTSDRRGAPVWLPAPAPDGRCSRCGRPWPCLGCGP